MRRRPKEVWVRGEGDGYPTGGRLYQNDPGYLQRPYINGDGDGGGEIAYFPNFLDLLRLRYEEDRRG